MRGATGVGTNTIIYTRQLNKKTKNCRNCLSGKCGEFNNKIYCSSFSMPITDAGNAKVCSRFKNKNGKLVK